MNTFRQLMMMCAALVLCSSALAQKTETQGWLFLTHTQKLNNRFDLLVDAQTRTADRFDYANSLLIRTALSYNLNKAHAIALGYAYKGDREKEMIDYTYTNEHRIFQQYLHKFKLAKTELMARGRLEQRWIKKDATSFSQRVRLFLGAQVPVFANKDFSEGVYTGIQNELFLNVTNKQNVNGRLFDQNRSFLSLGYRWSKAIDTEIGYMYWYQEEKEDAYRRNIIQLQITTSF